MQNPKIPTNQVIPNYELSLQQKLQVKYDFPPANRAYCNGSKSIEVAILKYYPKYYYSLHLDENYRRKKVFSRIKQIKTLDHFAWNFGEDIQSLKKKITKKVKNLLRNKRKSIKSLPAVGFRRYEKSYIMEMCPFFPRIQSLEVSLPRYYFPELNNHFVPRALEKEIEKAYGYFWKTLTHVKSVKMLTATPYFWLILQKINSSKPFLFKLKHFGLTIKYFNESVQKYSTIALFQILTQNQELLRCITHLNFGHFESFHYFGDQIKKILDNSPKLISLVFPVEKEFYSSHKKLPGPKHYLTLAPLQSLQNIRILTLKGYDVWGMIQAFEFPLLLEKLTLYLYYRSSWRPLWEDLYEEPSDGLLLKVKDQEKHQKLLNFFEKFKSLTLLKDLSLNMPRFTDTNHIMQNFILPLIKSIPNLKNLECQLYQGYLATNRHFDISTFLDGLQLESLKIFQQMRHDNKKYYFTNDDLVITYNPSESLSFPNLKSLEIDTWISQDFDFKNFFKTCQSQAVKEIHFTRIYMNSLESLQNLLSSFELSSLKISLEITLCVKSLTHLTQHFSNSSPIILPNNVSITLNVLFPSSLEGLILSKKGLETMLNLFVKLKLNVGLLCKKDFDWNNRCLISKSLMKNNKRNVSGSIDYYCIDEDDEHLKSSLQEDDCNSDIENGLLVDHETFYEEERKRERRLKEIYEEARQRKINEDIEKKWRRRIQEDSEQERERRQKIQEDYERERKRKIQEEYDEEEEDEKEDAQSEENNDEYDDQDSGNSSGSEDEERRMKELEEKKKKEDMKKVVLPVKVSQKFKVEKQKKDHGWKYYKLFALLLVLFALVLPLLYRHFSI